MIIKQTNKQKFQDEIYLLFLTGGYMNRLEREKIYQNKKNNSDTYIYFAFFFKCKNVYFSNSNLNNGQIVMAAVDNLLLHPKFGDFDVVEHNVMEVDHHKEVLAHGLAHGQAVEEGVHSHP